MRKQSETYLSIKNPKASRALKRALDPGHKLLTSLLRLRFATLANFGLRTWGPPWPNPGSAPEVLFVCDCIPLSVSFCRKYIFSKYRLALRVSYRKQKWSLKLQLLIRLMCYSCHQSGQKPAQYHVKTAYDLIRSIILACVHFKKFSHFHFLWNLYCRWWHHIYM